MPKRRWKLPRPIPGQATSELIDQFKELGETDVAAHLLSVAAIQLRNDATLDKALSVYLSDALIACVVNPEKAGHALGLIGSKPGRPPTVIPGERKREDTIIAAFVADAKSRFPKKPNAWIYKFVSEHMKGQPTEARVAEAWKKRRLPGIKLAGEKTGTKV